jgi:predicted amidohydrolase
VSALTVAAARYAIGAPRSFAEFADRQRAWLQEARALGAQVAVLPEYLSLELAATFEPAIAGDLHASLAATCMPVSRARPANSAHQSAW